MNTSRPRPTLPNPNEPLPGGGDLMGVLARGTALGFLLVMFLVWLSESGLL